MIASAVKAFGNLSKPSEFNDFRVRFRSPWPLRFQLSLYLCATSVPTENVTMGEHFLPKLANRQARLAVKDK